MLWLDLEVGMGLNLTRIASPKNKFNGLKTEI